jgi:hypothetical protein
VGLGLTAVERPGDFRWDLDAARADTSLATLHLGAETRGLAGFVALVARLAPSDDALRFELREASLAWTGRRERGDSLALRLFARQPQSLWIEHALVLPVDPAKGGGGSVLGGRVDAGAEGAVLTALAGYRGATLATPDDPTGLGVALPWAGYVVLRARGDAGSPRRAHVGATWKSFRPEGRSGDSEVLGFDLRAAAHGVQAAFEWAFSSPRSVQDIDPLAAAAGSTLAAPLAPAVGLAAEIPHDSALRFELRSPGLQLGRAGKLGFAPQLRAVGGEFDDPLAPSERDFGNPRRGVDGYRIEAWFDADLWPAWLRYAFDRHTQFADADRRMIVQTLEAQGFLVRDVRARVWYVQRDEQRGAGGGSSRHDDLAAEIAAGDGRGRLRLQAALVDVDAPGERESVALEAASRIGARWQALSRLGFATDRGRLRRTFFAELQYWHLPRFEFAVRYGPEWVGDGTDPALDGDLVAEGRAQDRVSLFVRGWF